MSQSLDIRMKRLDSTYEPGEKVSGAVVLVNKGSLSHSGINMEVEGTVTMQLSARSSGLFEAFYSSLKPIKLLTTNVRIADSGKLPEGTVELPFEFLLEATEGIPLIESYRGVFINVQYAVKVEVLRGRLAKNIHKTYEFYVRVPSKLPSFEKRSKHYSITQDSLGSKSSSSSVPSFSFKVNLHSSLVDIARPLTGELFVEECTARVRSIEMKLMRMEVIKTESGNIPEESEIQNIQIADGQVTRGLPVPLHMVLPSLYACPTVDCPFMKIDFIVNLVVRLEHHQEVTQPVPIEIIRFSAPL